MSTLRKRTKVGVAATVLGVGVLFGMAGPASAASASTTRMNADAGQASASGTAPDCVHRSVNGRTHEAVASNNCHGTMRLKIVVKHGYDSRCTSIARGKYLYHSWSFGSYDRTVTC
ncbi:hypothetical protein ABVG11_36205 [Streptomyces sp. HD1123-B1]|uniref:hypothetical protein n=1 Tax=Streptomyces huangiella TaxID=3228804 RepID=UPI003D7C8893